MKIELHEISIAEIVNGYEDKNEEGVFGYGGKLNIRPPYQREFVYKEKERDAVLDTVFKNFPLNVMYWSLNDNGTYEILDGQQRTVSICQFAAGDFSIILNGTPKYFHSLTNTEREKFLNYKLMIYFCEGDTDEKLAWFKVINIAGLKLTEQELRNVSYTGPWLSDAKKYFSKSNCPAYGLSSKYVSANLLRQELLEKALSWISGGKDHIEEYMAKHQQDPSAAELWLYFRQVIDWIPTVFKKYRSQMKGLPWGPLYDESHTKMFDPDKVETMIAKLMLDDELEGNKSGIYKYILSCDPKTLKGGDERLLNLRAFPDGMKIVAYNKQDGICPICHKKFEMNEMEADHIIPWSKGGKTVQENCQMLCMHCNRQKSGK